MSYASQSALVADAAFQSRCQAVFTEQALVFKDDGRPDIAALADHLLRHPNVALAGSASVPYGFTNILAGAPGFATQVELPAGGIDSSLIDDNEMLAATQAQWPTVAALYFDAEGNPKT